MAAYAPGYRPVATPHSDLFPTGVIESGAKRIAILRIALFEPQGSPSLCDQALAALSIPAQGPCDDACRERIGKFTARKFAEAFTDQIAALKQFHPDALLVDITHNGGGSEWAEAAARELTPVRLKSEQLRFVRGAHWIKKFADLENDLREAAAKATASDDKARLLGWAEQVAARRVIAAQQCDAAPLWRGKKPECEWLGSGFFATGLLGAADPEELRGKPWASEVFSPSEFPYTEGLWHGPLIVLVDSETWSAAEEFAAVLQDNHAAIIMGEPTGGAGCGHTDGGTPTTLKNSHAIMEVPDCSRIRAHGSNEVRGIEPDILIGFRHSDGPHLRARALAAQLDTAVARAKSAVR
jgi:C-terminal processing protease CtpA/Prc